MCKPLILLVLMTGKSRNQTGSFLSHIALDDDSTSHMVNLAAKGSNVAIAAFEDPTYDCYP